MAWSIPREPQIKDPGAEGICNLRSGCGAGRPAPLPSAHGNESSERADPSPGGASSSAEMDLLTCSELSLPPHLESPDESENITLGISVCVLALKGTA